jgi:hypothetical protein
LSAIQQVKANPSTFVHRPATSKQLTMQFSSLVFVVGVLGALGRFDRVDALARLIRVPLTRAITQEAGQLGQPVVSYYTTMNVGTPPKLFKIQFDIGSDESFLPHYSWNPFNRNMHYSTGYQCKVSSTCTKNNNEYNIEYQHVKLTGKRYEDLVTLNAVYSSGADATTMHPYLNNNNTAVTTIQPLNQLASWRQNFLAISSASDARFNPLPIDGFFGLGSAPQSTTGVSNVLTRLRSSNLIDNLQFSLWLNPVLDSPHGGTLVLGGVDTNLYQGKIYWHSLEATHANGWQLRLQSVSLGNQFVGCSAPGRTGCQARFSTGVSDIYGPRDDVMKIYSLLNTTKSSTGLHLIDCRRIPSLPYITFYIDGIPYYLYASNYIRKTVDGAIFKRETCYVAILPSDDDATTWTLSTPFLGAYYSIFDMTYRQIGFAALR